MQEGQKFPEFELPDEQGKIVRLADLRGSKAVIYFYPKDDTSGCTLQACAFRDDLASYGNTRIIGVSPDDTKSHRKFADKFSLPFTLLADVDHRLADTLGLWVEKSMYGKTYMGIARTTYLLDEDGTILKIWRKVKPQGHSEEVLAALQQNR